MKSYKPLTLLTGACLAVSLGLGIAGCSSATTDDHEVIGIEAENAQSVLVTNALAKNVTSFAIRESGSTSYGQNLIGSDVVFDAGEEDRLSFTPASEDLTALYDVRLTLEDGTEYEFIEIPLANAKSLSFNYADDVAFVDYVLSDDTEGSTKDAALARKAAAEEEAKKAEEEAKKAEEEAKKAAEEEAKRKAEEEAAAAAAAEEEAAAQEETYSEEPAYEEPTYEEPTYSEPEPTYEEPPAQEEDTCLPDVVFRD